MDNTSLDTSIIPVLRQGLRRFDIQNKDFILIFIHILQSWSVNKLWEFLSKNISNYNEIVHGITKKHIPNMENYFILRISFDKPTYYLNILFILTQCLPICKISWIKTNKIRTFSYVKKFNNKFSSFETKSMVKNFLYIVVFTHRLLSSLIFVSVGTLMDGMQKKRDGIRYFNEIFKSICICLQEIGNSHYQYLKCTFK